MRFTYFYDTTDQRRLAVWSTQRQDWAWVDQLLRNQCAESENSPRLSSEIESENRLFSAEFQGKVANALRNAESKDVFVNAATAQLRTAPLFVGARKILCIGLNYADHAGEFGDALPNEPVVFNKAPSALSYNGAAILLPRASSRVDYEGELVVAIGRAGRNIQEECALDYVGGYCCGNDVSARDWQKGKPAGQWFLGKSFDTFAPVGPALTTADEIKNPNELDIATRLNGRVMQNSNTRRFIFRIERLIAYISQVMTLEVGDLLFTGTPEGVGDARKPPVYLQDGDCVCVEIQGLGVLENPVEVMPK
ncbi:MAG: fumarylacetoacetate hydrolase family protein [Planctomycetia bacterium]|nr:fumarylacetoacetate hydrolase family protein [Planctomycetia bacterium]